MRICHLADTHIRNYRYHKEYRSVFEQLFTNLKEQEIDCIVHCGDIAHTKTQLSPEYFQLATEFLSGLADVAPTYIVLGNHDGNLKNSNRQDAITPIVNALGHPNLHLLKDAQEVSVGHNVVLNVLSVFDEENWITPTSEENINIALYHGAIAGVKTDIGWTMQEGDHSINIFEDFDYALLGDIHKTNQILDRDGKVRYPGSTVQQNFGETNDKGYLLWDIQDKETFTCEHFVLDNPKPFVTVRLTPTGRMPRNQRIPRGARVRLISENNLSVQQMHRAVEVAKHRFKPESVTFLNRSAGQRGNIEKYAGNIEQENLRDTAVLEKFIREYLKDYEISEDLLQRVLDLNRKYTSIVEESEEISRNVNWHVKTLTWDNLFNYGPANKIRFEKLNGVVGIFGKNFSGKSSVVDSLLYTIFNTTSKNERKNLNVINQQKDHAEGIAEIVIGSKLYTINRRSEKYTKKLKGEETLEAKVDLDFYSTDLETGEIESLNGLTRNETDKNIRRIFGTIDDFLNTSMASQLDSLSFIREGSTKRKEILANFLDLMVFEKKFRLSKEDSAEIKGALRRLGERNFDEEIKEAKKELYQAEKSLIIQQAACRGLLEKSTTLSLDIAEISNKIAAVPAEPIYIHRVNAFLEKGQKVLSETQEILFNQRNEIEEKKETLDKMSGFLENFDIDNLTKKEKQIIILVKQIDILKSRLEDVDRREELLAEVPCGDSYPSCKFIKDAVAAAKTKPSLETDLADLKEIYETLDEEVITSQIQQYNDISFKKRLAETKIRELELQIESNEASISKIEIEIEQLLSKKGVYEKNKEAIENLENLISSQKEMEAQAIKTNKRYEKCNEKISLLHRSVGSNEQKVAHLEEQRTDANNLRQEYTAYDLFMRCMHSNGIAYDIIKKRLPVVNEEIAKILANLTDFEAFFEEVGNKLEIFIKHPRHDPRPLSMASGAEKTMAAMAIRLALLSVSNLPKSDIMILDEPGTALDETHLQAFTQMLEIIKSKFRTVFLISHLDSLKDVSDMTIDISKKDGFAFVNQ